MAFKWVNTTAGVPIVSDFSATSGFGTPLIINLANGTLYYLTAAGTVAAIAGTVLATLRAIAMSGDVVWTVNFDGSGDVTAVASIQAKAVTLAKMADMATASLIYRRTAGIGVPEVNPLATLKTDLGLDGTNSGNSYKTIMQCGGSHIAGQVGGTYGLTWGNPIVVSGAGSLYPLAIIRIDSADFPTVNGIAPILRVRANLHCNDVAPTGNFTFGLYPVTRPATSGGAGVCIFTIGALVTGSGCTAISAPAADSSNTTNSADFALPANGYYVIAVVTSATVAVSSHLHMNAFLQQRNA